MASMEREGTRKTIYRTRLKGLTKLQLLIIFILIHKKMVETYMNMPT